MDEQQVQDQQVSEPVDNAPQDETLTSEQPQDVQPEQAEVVESAPVEQPIEVEETEEDENFPAFQLNTPELDSPLIDFSQLPSDENGNIDATALAEAMKKRDQAILNQAAAMVREQEERRQEERHWQKAFEKYPELKKDKSLAEEVNALRFGLFASDINAGKQGKMISPAQAFERINKRFAAQRAEGVRQATQNTRVEESVYVEPTSNASTSKVSDEESLFRQMRSPDRFEADAAAHEFLKKRLFG